MSSERKETATGLEVAVIGMAGRFPGANNIEQFWNNLKAEQESITFFSDAELEATGVDRELFTQPNYVRAKGILEPIEDFDANFFGYSPKDVQILDPQVRIFSECVWEALEDAGYDPYTHPGLIGLYAGANANYYWEGLALSLGSTDPAEQLDQNQLFDKEFIATRISYNLNLKGPSVFVANACSTSLVAVHLACRALLTGECDLALAGGVSVSLPHKIGAMYQEGMIMAPDGHCRAFDAQAAGTVWGEGAGVVVLKMLENAIQDGDHIYAVIKGTALNNDGSRKVGFSAPSIEGQAEVIRTALGISRVEPESISYVEAHGTGTILGDPIEIEALKIAFHTEQKQFCRIGSVKTNIGHLNTAAGIAGFIKTVLALKNRQIPASLHFQTPNPKIDFANSPFVVNTRLVDWQNDSYPLRAGVSSFGIGGANVHVVLQETPLPETVPGSVPGGSVTTVSVSGGSVETFHEMSLRMAPRSRQLILVSAKTETALQGRIDDLSAYLGKHPEVNFADFAYTLNVGRAHFPYRRAVVCADSAGALAILSKPAEASLARDDNPDLVFMFPGQGSQYPDLGRELYESEWVFRETFDGCREILRPLLGEDLKDILYSAASDSLGKPGDLKQRAEFATHPIYETALTQPVIFSVEYALAKLLMSWGLAPQSMIGHSIGEYVAACLAGVFSLEDALTLVTWRGRLMQEMAAGGMLSVPLSEAEIRPWLGDSLSVAAVNGPSLCVVSGPFPAVEALTEGLSRQKIEPIRLPVSHAFHSAMMDPVLPQFLEKVRQIKLNPPQIPYLSNLTGNWITDREATDPEYWVRHLRNTVRFMDGVAGLLDRGRTIMLEVGGGRTLTSLVKGHPKFRSEEHVALNSLKHPHETVSDTEHLLTMIGKLWGLGVRIDWEGFYPRRGRRLALPTYPFERKRYWIEGNINTLIKESLGKTGINEGRRMFDEWFYAPSWKRSQLIRSEKSPAGDLKLLVFTNGLGFSTRLTERLSEVPGETLWVKTGPAFQKELDFGYVINPTQRQDYQQLFTDLYQSGHIPQRIIHLWMLTEENRETSSRDLDLQLLTQATDLGFYSLIYTAQALGELNMPQPVFMKVITNQLQWVSGTEILCPEKAIVLGPAKIIPQEYPMLKCETIDIEIPKPGSHAETQLINDLLPELESASDEAAVAIRGKLRWTPCFEPVKLSKSPEAPDPLRKNGIYLITGGFGGIGLALAEYLATAVAAKLILIGRTALPGRPDWEDWLNHHPESDPISHKLRAIERIEQMGGEVCAIQADVADAAQLQKAFNQIKERFGTIHGVIHCAGLADGAIIQRRNRETTDGILAPKVKGMMNLHQELQGSKLDFIINCSSLLSIIPTVGQAGYCAANSFLDAYAHYKNSSDGTFTVSINWDGWREVGMMVDPKVSAPQTSADNGGRQPSVTWGNGISSQEGVEIFKRVLHSSFIQAPVLNQVIVSTDSLEERYQKTVTLDLNQLQTDLTDETKREQYARPELTTPYLAPRNEVEAKLAELWQEILGFEKIGIRDDFFELGGHSLKIVILKNRIYEELGVKVKMEELFTISTIQEIAEMIQRKKMEMEKIETMLQKLKKLDKT